MRYFIAFIGTVLGYLMWFLYGATGNYVAALVLFTLLTKLIMLPLSLWVQKNSITLVRIRPELDALKYQHTDDEDAYLSEQKKLYKREKYSPMAGVWPLFVQLPLIFGIIDIVYKPLKHLLHMSAASIDALCARAAEMLGVELGGAAQLRVIELVSSDRAAEFAAGLPVALSEDIRAAASIDMRFLGLDLAEIPSLSNPSLVLLVPLLSALSALVMCVVQNKINVLQIEQSNFAKWSVTALMVGISGYFALVVPAAVGLYWILGNLLAILVTWLCNVIYDPKKYIDYKLLEETKKTTRENQAHLRANRKRAKADYKRFCKEDNQASMRVMFYSEQSGFYKYFENLIEALLRRSDIDIHYVTSDPDDAIFKKDEPRIIPYYIDEDRLIPLMMKVESDIVVMTMPDIEKYHIKRSRIRKDVEYIFMDHGCVGINMCYRTGALDHYDTFFAVSQNQIDEIRAIEKLRGTKTKNVVEVGYGLIDNMIAAYNAGEGRPDDGKKRIIIAPSWQYDNIMDSCLDELLGCLLHKGYDITVRPHPQYIRRFPQNMQGIIERYKDEVGDDFRIETDFSSSASIYNSDILISDWSAVAFEFSFTTNKPSLFINTEMKVTNKDYDKIDIVPYDITGRDDIGKSIEKDEAAFADEIIRDMLEHQDDYRDKINDIRNKHFFNLGHSGDAGADYILKRLSEIKRPDYL